jgi:hypothetical protein
MDAHDQTGQPAPDPQADVVAYLKGRSSPCPRCGYDLRDIQTAKCPECGDPLVLKIGTLRPRFGWLVLSMVPGCFSGVAAVFVLVPVIGTLWQGVSPERIPWPAIGADIFGWLSAGSVILMYRHRQRLMAWTTRRQATFAAAIWGIHVLALGLLILSVWLIQR